MCFSATFWNEKYQNNETGWDLKSASRPLKEYFDQIENKNIKILIPGCGNAYEAEYLLEQGFQDITLVDISEVVVKNLQEKFSDFSQIQVLNQDFFTINSTYDLVIEQTFFCALNPNLREKYVKKMNEIIHENGKLVGVLFNKNFGNDFPPFGGNKDEYQRLFEPYFNFNTFEACYNSIKPRSGSELFIHLTPIKKEI